MSTVVSPDRPETADRAPVPSEAIYEGVVGHRRLAPVGHAFRYPLYLAFVDPADFGSLRRRLPLGRLGRLAPVRFDRADHLGDPDVPLDTAVRDLVEAEVGERPTGPIRLLTQARTFGWLFNPLSVHYCFEPDGRLGFVVLDVSNTPWHERHPYVIDLRADEGAGTRHRAEFPKAFHVSPFMPIDQTYRLEMTEPGHRIDFSLESFEADGKVFSATMQLRRRPFTRSTWWEMVRRYPLVTLRVSAGIYRQAFRLWRKGVPVHRHPGS